MSLRASPSLRTRKSRSSAGQSVLSQIAKRYCSKAADSRVRKLFSGYLRDKNLVKLEEGNEGFEEIRCPACNKILFKLKPGTLKFDDDKGTVIDNICRRCKQRILSRLVNK